MRRRILAAIVGVTVVATMVLTLPLALLMSKREHADADRELALTAEKTANEVTSDSDFADSDLELPIFEESLTVGVYLPDGRRIAGRGPDRADELTAATELLTIVGHTFNERVLVRPIVERERAVGFIRVSEPLSEAERLVWRDVAILLGFDAAAIIVAAIVGSLVAARLVRPLRAIRDDAVRLGDGDFSIVPTPSGIDELDATASALADTAVRLDGVLRRERAFTADASHQLRTPLTSLRLAIETELQSPSDDPSASLETALTEIDRLEDTITTLLRVARDQPISRDPIDLDHWIADVRRRWITVLSEQRRDLAISLTADNAPAVSRHVLDQIVEILVNNAVRHGRGQVTIDVAEEGDQLVVAVSDEGSLDRSPGELFVRRDPGASGHGLGLALARSLAEAEGGRVVLGSTEPTTFRVLLPGSAARLTDVNGSA